MALPAANTIIRVLTVGLPLTIVAVLVAVGWALSTARRHRLRALLVPLMGAMYLSMVMKQFPLVVEDLVGYNNNKTNYTSSSVNHEYPWAVADLHSDTLLWSARDFLKTVPHPFLRERVVGHVDLPRLIKGNVRLQVFAIVNEVPRTINFERNGRPTRLGDALTVKAVLEGWPKRTWTSPRERVLYQAERLHEAARRSNGLLSVVRARQDLDGVDGEEGRGKVLGILAIEGLSCLEGSIDVVDDFYNVGVRVMGPTHFHDTEVGGSLSGECECGLSEFGKRVMVRMRELGMIVDVAHAHPKLVSDILNMSDEQRPAIMLSHTGVRSECDTPRNVPDKMLEELCNHDTLLGVTLFAPAICGDDLLESFLRTTKKMMSLCAKKKKGIVGMGSDWDGSVRTVVCADETHMLDQVLRGDGGLGGGREIESVESFLFGNVVSFFRRHLK